MDDGFHLETRDPLVLGLRLPSGRQLGGQQERQPIESSTTDTRGAHAGDGSETSMPRKPGIDRFEEPRRLPGRVAVFSDTVCEKSVAGYVGSYWKVTVVPPRDSRRVDFRFDERALRTAKRRDGLDRRERPAVVIGGQFETARAPASNGIGEVDDADVRLRAGASRGRSDTSAATPSGSTGSPPTRTAAHTATSRTTRHRGPPVGPALPGERHSGRAPRSTRNARTATVMNSNGK